jgi:hypothetical protein
MYATSALSGKAVPPAGDKGGGVFMLMAYALAVGITSVQPTSFLDPGLIQTALLYRPMTRLDLLQPKMLQPETKTTTSTAKAVRRLDMADPIRIVSSGGNRDDPHTTKVVHSPPVADFIHFESGSSGPLAIPHVEFRIVLRHPHNASTPAYMGSPHETEYKVR